MNGALGVVSVQEGSAFVQKDEVSLTKELKFANRDEADSMRKMLRSESLEVTGIMLQ